MPHFVNRRVFIGLGGTGRDAVLNVKKKCIEVYGEVPPSVSLLVIDTTEPKDIEAEDGTRIGLSPSEFLFITSDNPRDLIKNSEEVQEWFPTEGNIPTTALDSGAAQIRCIGKLALYQNSDEVTNAVKRTITRVQEWEVDRGPNDKFQLRPGGKNDVKVSLIFSTAGGTGSGCFLDIAYLIRDVIGSSQDIIGYALLPDIFKDRPATGNVLPNAYASFMELDHYMNQKYDLTKANDSFKFAGRKISIETPPFNVVYCLNNTDQRNNVYTEISDLTEFIGIGCFLSVGDIGKDVQDIYSNLKAQIGNHKPLHGKSSFYASFGVSELVYDADHFADITKMNLAVDLLSKIFKSSKEANYSEDADKFIDAISIREDTADEVLDAILKIGDFKKFPLPAGHSKDDAQKVINHRTSHIDQNYNDLKVKAEKNVQALKNAKTNALKEIIWGESHKSGGLNYAKNFLSAFSQKMSDFKDMMHSEKELNESHKGRMSGAYSEANSRLTEASAKVFSKNPTKSAMQEFKNLVEKECRLDSEIMRREYAIEFYVHIIDRAKKLSESVVKVLENAAQNENQLIQKIHKKRTSIRSEKPFVQHIEPKDFWDRSPEAPSEDFLKWMTKDKKIELLNLEHHRLEDLMSLLDEYLDNNDMVKRIRHQSIKDVLEELGNESVIDLIKKMDETSVPLWQYRSGLLSGSNTPEKIYLFGVPSRNDTAFTADRISKAVTAQHAPQTVSTEDSQRIFCFKAEAAIPAFGLKQMEEYKARYLEIKNSRTPHSDKKFINRLPDIFPEADNKEGKMYWAVAFSPPFDLITKRGTHYYLHDGDITKKYDQGAYRKLESGRTKSMEKFLSDATLVDDLKAKVEHIAGKQGNDLIIDKLEEYIGSLVQNKAKSTTDEGKNQFDLEKQCVQDYIESLSTTN